MATIVILKKTGKEILIPVNETATDIFLLINGEDRGMYNRRKFVDAILLTKPGGAKLGINPRFIAYYHD